MENNLKPIPKIGEFYHFWDDGKSSTSRHYICKCERILSCDEAKEIVIEVPEWDEKTNNVNYYKTTLYDHWHDYEMPNCDWLYAENTDFFIECSCPVYDDNNLWFVRTKCGGWFSMNIQSSWQSGSLDIDKSQLNGIIEEIKKHPEYYKNPEKAIKEYTECKYEKK